MKKATKTKKRNPTDSTTRNVKASQKRDDKLERSINALKKRVKALELAVSRLELGMGCLPRDIALPAYPFKVKLERK